MKDGSDQPIAFASRTLAPVERNYSQLEREGLAIIFGIKKFHQYLLGHDFVVHSDHQPLKYLFGETRAIPVLASSRIQRWALFLSSYSYSVQYKPGRQLANADALSRLPLDPHSEAPAVKGNVLLLRDHLEGSVVTSKQIQQWTSKDPIMATVRKFMLQVWPELNQQRELQPFFNRRHELTVVDGCVLWVLAWLSHLQNGQLSSRNFMTHTWASLRWRVWHAAMCGGHHWMVTLKESSTCARHVELDTMPQPLHRCIHGSGLAAHGLGFTLTTQDHSSERCFCARGCIFQVVGSQAASAKTTIYCLQDIFVTRGLPARTVPDNAVSSQVMSFASFWKRMVSLTLLVRCIIQQAMALLSKLCSLSNSIASLHMRPRHKPQQSCYFNIVHGLN